MAQTKIIVDSNSYFRLAQNIHPLLCEPFGERQFTVYIHSELSTEFKRSARLKNKFHWFTEPRFVANRSRTISLSAENKKEIESTYEYLWEHVQDEFLKHLHAGQVINMTKLFLTPSIFFDFFLYSGIFPLPNGVQITHLQLDSASYQPCTKP